MVVCGGKERTEKEWTELLAQHGFKATKFIRTSQTSDFHLIESVRL